MHPHSQAGGENLKSIFDILLIIIILNEMLLLADQYDCSVLTPATAESANTAFSSDQQCLAVLTNEKQARQRERERGRADCVGKSPGATASASSSLLLFVFQVALFTYKKKKHKRRGCLSAIISAALTKCAPAHPPQPPPHPPPHLKPCEQGRLWTGARLKGFSLFVTGGRLRPLLSRP